MLRIPTIICISPAHLSPTSPSNWHNRNLNNSTIRPLLRRQQNRRVEEFLIIRTILKQILTLLHRIALQFARCHITYQRLVPRPSCQNVHGALRIKVKRLLEDGISVHGDVAVLDTEGRGVVLDEVAFAAEGEGGREVARHGSDRVECEFAVFPVDGYYLQELVVDGCWSLELGYEGWERLRDCFRGSYGLGGSLRKWYVRLESSPMVERVVIESTRLTVKI